MIQLLRCEPRVDDVERRRPGRGGDDPDGLHQDSPSVRNDILLILGREIHLSYNLGKFPSTLFCSVSSLYLRAYLWE